MLKCSVWKVILTVGKISKFKKFCILTVGEKVKYFKLFKFQNFLVYCWKFFRWLWVSEFFSNNSFDFLELRNFLVFSRKSVSFSIYFGPNKPEWKRLRCRKGIWVDMTQIHTKSLKSWLNQGCSKCGPRAISRPWTDFFVVSKPHFKKRLGQNYNF